MNNLTVLINEVEKVKKFVRITTKYASNFDLKADRYVVDAKSIMGIYSMNLSKPLTLVVIGPEEEFEAIKNDLKEFII